MDLGALPTAAEMAELSGADLDRVLVELETARRKLEAAYVAVLDRADDTGRFRGDGHASVRGWAIALTNSSPVETRRRLQTMRALRDLPEAARPARLDDVDAKRCETTTGITMSARDAVIASMIGYVRRVVIDPSGRVTELGRRRRFTGAAREAVLLDGRRCVWPGCGRASSRNQIDHTHEHARGGLTTPENGGPACGRHNRIKSRGYAAHRDADGVWHVHRPDGSELTEPAAA